jgi:glucose-6-phosphate 1-dehydrogenase
MMEKIKPEPMILIIFGAGGDLTWRKLVPAIHSLFIEKWLPEKFRIIGIDIKEMNQGDFQARLRDGACQFSRYQPIDEDKWNEFAGHLEYIASDFSASLTYQNLVKRIDETEKEWSTPSIHIFYQATLPSMVETIVKHIGEAGLAKDRLNTRIVLEKPFGRDLASAQALNQMLANVFDESQIFRIDHYLGKETVQNILAFRFANALFEPIWDRRYIDHVQITVTEQVGVEHRGAYYDHAGALRDMIQNHLLQVLCLIAMEPPVSFDDKEIRNKKVDVLHAIRLFDPQEVHEFAVRGQYGSGWIEGQHLKAYRNEEGVSPDSNTETYAAVKLFVDNWRWQDVPFYLRTGKCMPAKVSEAIIQFRAVPHQSFPSTASGDWLPNRLIIHIQPDEGISLCFQAKRPGTYLRLSPVDMRFRYREAFKTSPPEAYETLLYDVMMNDATLFMRADQVEAAWSILTPILDGWEAVSPENFPNYQSGTWGPEEAVILTARDGRSWVMPSDDEKPEEKKDEDSQ